MNTARKYTAYADQVTEPEWADLLTRFDDASIYQTWSYGTVCWNPKQLSHLVLKRDQLVVAIAQVRVVRLPVIGKGIAYVRWGPLCRLRGQPLQEEVLREVIIALKREYTDRRGLLLRIVPNAYPGDAGVMAWATVLEESGFRPDPAVHVYRTMRVDLTPPLEEIRKKLHSRWRSYLRNAEKNGYKVVEGASVELYETFLVLYRQMMERKQFETTVDVEEFKQLQQALPNPLKFHVLVCQKEHNPLNALVISHVGESAIYLLAATGEEGLKERGAHLLQWRAVEWLKERGCRWYDVGGINPDRNPGVYQFKSGLGGDEARQLGGFEFRGDWVSSAIVTCGERLRIMLQGLRARRRAMGMPSNT
jgi:hypothetical protein